MNRMQQAVLCQALLFVQEAIRMNDKDMLRSYYEDLNYLVIEALGEEK